MTSHLATLVRKDLRLHGGAYVLVLVGLGLFGFVLTRADAGNHDRNAPFFLNLTLLTSALWAEWLIAREKSKETFAWLRTLPVSDVDVVMAKFLLAGAATAVTWTGLSLAFMWSLFLPARMGLWLVFLAGCMSFGALVVACRWRLGPRLGQMAPFGLLFLVLACILVLPASVADSVERSLLRPSEGRQVPHSLSRS